MISAANSVLLSSLWSSSISTGQTTCAQDFGDVMLASAVLPQGLRNPRFSCLWLLFCSGPSPQLFVLGSQPASGRGLYSQGSPDRTCEVKLQQQGQVFAACWELLP